jgi:hypothetical protein
MLRRIAMTVLFSCSLFACGAEGDDYDPTYQNQLFAQTARINAAQDGSASTPGFSWIATGYRHVVCAVFSSPIHVKENQITNADDVVWIWHSGLGTGREGNIRYGDGRPHPASSDAPAPLGLGVYYWGVWALDDAGHAVASSVECTLMVP